MARPIISTKSSVMGIFCKSEFEQLTEKEQQYCNSFAKACWEGAKLCYFQKSYESPAIFTILQLVFSSQGQNFEQFKAEALKVVSEDEYNAIVTYSAAFFNNCGNFLSFGHSKFIPDVSEEVFFKFIQVSQNYLPNKQLIDSLWEQIKGVMFSNKGKLEKIGYPPEDGQSGFYSQNITKEEILFVDEFLQVMSISPLNTRVIKSGEDHYQVLIASVIPKKDTRYYQGKRIDLSYGDYSTIMKNIAVNLEEAIEYAANPLQKQMLKKYVEHFVTGDIETHKDSQRLWVRDIGPIVETCIGFIETYLDPKQSRAYYEGFVSLVNKEKSKITTDFVNQQAQKLLELMPWPVEFEKDKFLKPDFTVLSILAFGSIGTPLGINIPNYDDIRQEEGFKNVYLENCFGKMKKGGILFYSQKDCDILEKYDQQIGFHKVIYHELLGHGCGKLFQKTDSGLNFDENLKNPLTGEKISSYYKEKDTWQSIFQNYSNPYEECRADSVALYFSCLQEATQALQPEYLDNWKELCVGQFLSFIYQAIIGLSLYNVAAKKWGQAHINGRWVIFQVLLEAGNNFINIEKVKNSEGKDTLKIDIDHEQCFTTGKTAMQNFLLKLQVYKSTADFENGQKMFAKYSEVNEKFLEIREVVIANKKPRRLTVFGHLTKNCQGKCEYTEFPETHEGIIQFYMKTYPHMDQEMLRLFYQHQKVTQPLL